VCAAPAPGLPHASVIAYAQQRGVVVVAAAGNDGTDALYYPGRCPVCWPSVPWAPTGRSRRSPTWGDQVDLVAPGVDIYSCLLDGGYGFASGTSQASPYVAGAVALLRSQLQTAARHCPLARPSSCSCAPPTAPVASGVTAAPARAAQRPRRRCACSTTSSTIATCTAATCPTATSSPPPPQRDGAAPLRRLTAP
jgi:subtilisin family serine protease